jgi:GT2 family glycosyltransferase
LPDYYNPNSYAVLLPGPDGQSIQVQPGRRLTLSAFYDRYRIRGLIQLVGHGVGKPVARSTANMMAKRVQPKMPKDTPKKVANTRIKNRASRVVGRSVEPHARSLIAQSLNHRQYAISNGLGVGILSYNRPRALERLMQSIMQHTDLHRTTVFISDDASDNAEVQRLLDSYEQSKQVVVLRSATRGGVAANTNQLLHCLARFPHALILNDDVEVLARGWEYFYRNVMLATGYHHLMHQEPGVYGQGDGQPVDVNGYALRRTDDKPHGAILAFDAQALAKVGHFDEAYGLYGMEHVDWSMRVYELGLQPHGFFDAEGSNQYFRIHKEQSALAGRQDAFRHAKTVFAHRQTGRKIEPQATDLPAVSYIVPFRDCGRTGAVMSIVDSIRAQKFPIIDIVLAEQDSTSHINPALFGPMKYLLVNNRTELFNKSRAFNQGVAAARHRHLILHDADIMARVDYTSDVYQELSHYDACHIGKHVIYADQESTDKINQSGEICDASSFDRVVGYFEGGSLACTKEAYREIGGFNEQFEGYGVEDCDFYYRLSHLTGWHDNRHHDFVHLWHPRVLGWEAHHAQNKSLGSSLAALKPQQRIEQQRQRYLALGYGAS